MLAALARQVTLSSRPNSKQTPSRDASANINGPLAVYPLVQIRTPGFITPPAFLDMSAALHLSSINMGVVFQTHGFRSRIMTSSQLPQVLVRP